MSQAPSWKADRLRVLEAQKKARGQARLKSFKPYPKQQQFFEMGLYKRTRLAMAGTQCGKSESGAFEMAVHLTGLYPEWWRGKRFDHPIRAWAAGEGATLTRDVLQFKLCGQPGSEEDYGTGLIPRACLLSHSAGHGVTNSYDTITVRHVSGGVSTLSFKSYEQGRAKFQSATLDAIWFDEEPPADVYSEGLARLTGEGIAWVTFTPLKGYTEVISSFLSDDSMEARRDRGVVRWGLKDAEHFTQEEKERRLAGYPPHERAARENGDPMLGSGSVFPGVLESDIATRTTLTDFPPEWPLLWGIDFGIGHPFAAVLTAWDRDTDTIYVLDAFKIADAVPAIHASRIKAVAPQVLVAWPHDGAAREAGSGQTLASQYKREGLRMRGEHAQFSDGGYSTEAGIADMYTRMKTGRFKVVQHLLAGEWGEEFRRYHRKDGLIVKVFDDLMSATRIAVMDHRHAQPEPFDPRTGRGMPGVGNSKPYSSDFDLLTGRPFDTQPSSSFDLFTGNPWSY